MKYLDIKRALADHNMTQVQLGEKLNVLPQSLTSVIKGNPTVAKLMQIAEGIGCDITDLFYPDPADEAAEKERRDIEMEQEIKKAFENAKDNKTPLEQTLRDLTRRAYPSITEEEVKEWVEAITKKKGVQTFSMTPNGQRLQDVINKLSQIKERDDETLNTTHRTTLGAPNWSGLTDKHHQFAYSSSPLAFPAVEWSQEGKYIEKLMKDLEAEKENEQENAQTAIQTATFCPHCGKKVRVGVVLLPEE